MEELRTVSSNEEALRIVAEKYDLEIKDLDIIPDPGDNDILWVSYGPEDEDVEGFHVSA